MEFKLIATAKGHKPETFNRVIAINQEHAEKYARQTYAAQHGVRYADVKISKH